MEIPRENIMVSNPLNKLELKYSKSDIPTNSTKTPVPINTVDRYLTFTPTDMDKDFSQTVIPYFDAQEVVSDPPTPLGGLGLFLKGAEGFEGFVAPRIRKSKYAYYFERDSSTLTHTADEMKRKGINI